MDLGRRNLDNLSERFNRTFSSVLFWTTESASACSNVKLARNTFIALISWSGAHTGLPSMARLSLYFFSSSLSSPMVNQATTRWAPSRTTNTNHMPRVSKSFTIADGSSPSRAAFLRIPASHEIASGVKDSPVCSSRISSRTTIVFASLLNPPLINTCVNSCTRVLLTIRSKAIVRNLARDSHSGMPSLTMLSIDALCACAYCLGRCFFFVCN